MSKVEAARIMLVCKRGLQERNILRAHKMAFGHHMFKIFSSYVWKEMTSVIPDTEWE